jgi:thiamine-monophosphate kinase
LVEEARRAGVTLTSIGTVVAATERLCFLDGQGRELVLKRMSSSHF